MVQKNNDHLEGPPTRKESQKESFVKRVEGKKSICSIHLCVKRDSPQLILRQRGVAGVEKRPAKPIDFNR